MNNPYVTFTIVCMKSCSRMLIVLLIAAFLLTSCKKDSQVNNGTNAATGASANNFLSADTYKSLNVEIQYMPGYKPDDASLNNFKSFLKARLNKPDGINFIQREISPQSGKALSVNDIILIENNSRSLFSSANGMAAYILITDGEYAAGNRVLGIAYRNTSVALFGKTIHENSGNIGQTSREKLETTVLDHEFGHLFGLVDNGSPMQQNHLDAAHGKHCNNPDCLMYYASETTDILGILLTGNIPQPDANCIADLRANGGK